MRAFGVVELQRAGERFEDAFGDAAEVAALQSGVVGNADAGQDRDLFAAQPENAPRTVGGEPGLVRGDLGSPGGQELPDLGLGVHAQSLNRRACGWETLPVPLSTGTLTRLWTVLFWSHDYFQEDLVDHRRRPRHGRRLRQSGARRRPQCRRHRPQPGHRRRGLGESDDLLVVKLDVTSGQDAQAAVTAAVDRFGAIDVLVNNAGSNYAGFFEELTAEQIERQLTVNLFGPMNVTRAVLPVMRKQRSGHVVTISSTAGFAGYAGGTAYATSKFAVDGWMESLAPEVAPFGIHVTIVNPGFFRTELLTNESTIPARESIEDYAEGNRARREFFAGMNGNQVGDPAKLAQALLMITEIAAAAAAVHRRRRRNRSGRGEARRTPTSRSMPSARCPRRWRSLTPTSRPNPGTPPAGASHQR